MKCFKFPSWRKKDEPKNPAPTPSNLRVFTVSELKSATNNFSHSSMLGETGSGSFYKGYIKSLDDSSQKIEVAVKQLSEWWSKVNKEWANEVQLLGKFDHPNLVKLLGYCAEDDESGIQRLLIYEHMPNTSVKYLLSERSETPLSWAMRLKIAQDVARGLAYLHEGMDGLVFTWRNFQSSNILLDDQWRAKIVEFGLTGVAPWEGSSYIPTAVAGSMAYSAPEIIQTAHLTSKGDVWSYGIFLYELITGRRPLDRNRSKGEQELMKWVKPYLSEEKKFELIMDPRLEGEYQLESAKRLASVANRCLTRNPKSRPKMSEVLGMVNKIVDTLAGAYNPQIPTSKSST